MLRHFLLALVSTGVWSFGAPDATHSDNSDNVDEVHDSGREHAWQTVQYADHDEQIEGLTYETFLGPKVSLKVGEVANAIWPIDWIKGPAAIRYFTTQIVDGDGNDVPAEELYVHHWFLLNTLDNTNMTFMSFGDITFESLSMGYCYHKLPGYGTGAELNEQVLVFPRPLAWVMTGEEYWGLNQHFIRTDGIAPEKFIPCIECQCEDSTPEEPHGSHFCENCLHGAQCWGMEGVESEAKDYYLKYTIGYEDITDDTVPMAVLSVDGVQHKDGTCANEYDVKIPTGEGEEGVEDVVVDHMDFVMTQDFNVTLVASHLHIGGINLTVENWRDDEMEGVVCHAEAGYDSKGMLIEMPFCLYAMDEAYPLKEGDTLRIIGSYDKRTVVGAPEVNFHMGVMTLAWLFGHAADREQLLEDSKVYQKTFWELAAAAAGEEMASDNWSPFKGVELKPLTTPDGTAEGWDVRARLTCDNGAVWCGFGVNNQPIMADAIVYTISEGDDGEMALQKRKLGDHHPGELLDVDVSEITTNEDGSISAEFTMGPLPEDYECVLAAVGSSPSFGYHSTEKLAFCPEAEADKEVIDSGEEPLEE